MKNRFKKTMLAFCTTLLFSPVAVVPIEATENIKEGVTENTKTSINDLLHTSDMLISPVDYPVFDGTSYKVLINGESGQVLYSDGADTPFAIYSVTKALAVFVIMDKLKEKNPEFTLQTEIPATGRPVLVSYEHGFSNLSLIEGQGYTVEELLDSIIIHSANASTMLVGEYITKTFGNNGGELEFVQMMNEKAETIGLKHSSIFTSTGLDKNDLLSLGYGELNDGVNQMSASDVAFMTMKILDDYPELTEISKKTRGTFGVLTEEPYEYETTVALLPGEEYAYDGVNGLKTGGDIFEYTSSIVFTAEKDGTELIGVISGSRNPDVRSTEAHTLLNFAFNTLDHQTVLTKESLLFGTGTVKTKYTWGSSLAVEVEDDFILSYSKSYTDFQPDLIFIPTNNKYVASKNSFKGPIKKGEILGKIVVPYEDLTFLTDKDVTEYSVNVIAKEDTKNGFFLFNMFEWIFDKLRK